MKRLLTFSFFLLPLSFLLADTSEITVDLKLDQMNFVAGERIRGVVDVANMSAGVVSVGYDDSVDRLFLDVFRSSDGNQLDSVSSRTFVAPFRLESCEGQKLETFLADHYGLDNPGSFLVKPVLVHGGIRYEGQTRAFDVVPGMRIGGAMQLFSNRTGLQRDFDLITWNRLKEPHLFLRARDSGPAAKKNKWNAIDLGPMMKITAPTISVMPTGEVIVLHRVDPDNFIRSEFWSVPDTIEFHSQMVVQDPETAGTARVREMYKESGGITPKQNPWWKFW